MRSKKRIKISDLVNDIRGGLSDIDLMVKYQLSVKGLQSAFRKLLDGNCVTRKDLDERMSSYDDTIDIDDVRKFPRNVPAVPITIYDTERPDAVGTLWDITETGVGARGIEAAVDQIKTLAIMVGKFSEFDPFEIEAKCRWVRRSRHDGELATGFEITNISEESLRRLRELISGLTLETDSNVIVRP